MELSMDVFNETPYNLNGKIALYAYNDEMWFVGIIEEASRYGFILKFDYMRKVCRLKCEYNRIADIEENEYMGLNLIRS